MKSSKMLWRLVGSAAFISTLLFVFGFFYAAQDIINPKPSDMGIAPTVPNTNNELANKDKITIVALGDSLTKGTGDESGDGGYVGKAKKSLETIWKKPVYSSNQAINGWRTENLLESLDKPNLQNLLKQADIIMLTIGGNDLNQAANNPMDAPKVTPTDKVPADTQKPDESLSINYDLIRKTLPASEENLKKILTKVAAYNPNAKIVYVALYNPFYVQDVNKEGTAIIQQWNLKAQQIANGYPNMIVVPTFDLFQFDIKKYLYIDEFHPNSLGYGRIAERVVQALQ
jgi:lysophospholipase L1-like esterase